MADFRLACWLGWAMVRGVKLRWIALSVFLVSCAGKVEPVPRAVSVPPVAAPPPAAGALWPVEAPTVHARTAILIDARTGRTLYQKNADVHTPAASTQKLLTALLVTEAGALDRPVVIAPSDTRVEPTKLSVRAGQSYTRRELLAALLIESQNDAAAALGRDHSGSEGAFAQAMNAKAFNLGASQSFFANPHGLPAAQHSTARDMARIAFRAYRDPFIRQCINTRDYTFVYNTGRVKRLENTNKLLKRSFEFNGMKTGYTIAAGRCLIASISTGGRELIFVQLGSKTQYIFDDAERMLRWGVTQTGGGPLF